MRVISAILLLVLTVNLTLAANSPQFDCKRKAAKFLGEANISSSLRSLVGNLRICHPDFETLVRTGEPGAECVEQLIKWGPKRGAKDADYCRALEGRVEALEKRVPCVTELNMSLDDKSFKLDVIVFSQAASSVLQAYTACVLAR